MTEDREKQIVRGFTPRQIVFELDKYIIGQGQAKRSVAVALRNRWRRQQLSEELREEIAPKNIIMIGPTGVGKTEIARRIARLVQSPFLKIEASKFTEVGYVGRDVESMIRDLMELAVNMVRQEENERLWEKAKELAEERVLSLLIPPPPKKPKRPEPTADGYTLELESSEESEESYHKTREKFRRLLKEGKLDDRPLDLETQDKAQIPMVEIFSSAGAEEMDINIRDMFGNMFPKKKKRRTVKVSEALEMLAAEEVQKLIDMDKVIKLAKDRVEQSGIIFLDELDKVAGTEGRQHGPDVSREGVQRDLLPIVEGSTVNTKYGMIRTDHILFIAAGAFNVSKPSDLIPELQGRFPIRVELDSLGAEEFVRILTEPKNALILQYEALLDTEGVTLKFTDDAIKEIARIAAEVNERAENIGARRLHTVMEKLLDEVSFDAPEIKGQDVVVDADYVRERLESIIKDEDLSRYIL